MLEVRFLGRGGQGAVIAAELLAQAAFLDGKIPQSFPFFGVERRGAPVTAYARVDDAPIGVRTSITTPDVVVVLERGLLQAVPATEGLKDGGWLLVNAPASVTHLPAPPRVRVAAVDANRIALLFGLGSKTLPIVNTAMLGALAQLTGIVSLRSLDRAIERSVPARPQQNRAACRAGYDDLRVLAPDRLPRVQVRRAGTDLPFPEGPIASVPSDVIHTSSWRTLRPEIDRDACTRCNFCWKYCPDDAITLDAEGFPVVQGDHCKGCGICAEVCPPDAIAMVPEEEVVAR